MVRIKDLFSILLLKLELFLLAGLPPAPSCVFLVSSLVCLFSSRPSGAVCWFLLSPYLNSCCSSWFLPVKSHLLPVQRLPLSSAALQVLSAPALFHLRCILFRPCPLVYLFAAAVQHSFSKATFFSTKPLSSRTWFHLLCLHFGIQAVPAFHLHKRWNWLKEMDPAEQHAMSGQGALLGQRKQLLRALVDNSFSMAQAIHDLAQQVSRLIDSALT